MVENQLPELAHNRVWEALGNQYRVVRQDLEIIRALVTEKFRDPKRTGAGRSLDTVGVIDDLFLGHGLPPGERRLVDLGKTLGGGGSLPAGDVQQSKIRRCQTLRWGCPGA